MRARLAIASAQITCELREIVLRDKAPAFLEASPKGTVPVVVTPEGRVIEESFDVMLWALGQHDPEALMTGPGPETSKLIADNDGPFKAALDRYKYPNRYKGVTRLDEQSKALTYLEALETQLGGKPWLFGNAPRLADLAILPFVRQFAHVDKNWFDALPLPGVQNWLARFLESDRLAQVFAKHPKWVAGDAVTTFPH